jgi:hypothetical protein
MGRAYMYLSEESRSEAFRTAEDDVEFAIGLGHGIGTVYNYLECAQKDQVIAHTGDNSGFSRGLGFGLGSVFSYLGEDVKNEILARSARNEQLSLGLGSGLAMHISYLSHVVAQKIFDLAKSNPFLAAGLGEGCAVAFSRMPQNTKGWLSSHFSSTDGFAFGFGAGIGKIRKYLERGAFEEAASFAKSDQFAKGLAIGLGSACAHLPRDLLIDMLSSNNSGDDFARNFGFGLGHVFSTLDGAKRKEVFEIAKNNEEFLTGLGEGAGHYLPATGSRPIDEIMQAIDSLNLARGAALGIKESFRYLNLAEAHGLLEYAGSRPEYGEVLGRGLAAKFATFDQDMQSQILDALRKESNFTRAFVAAIPQHLAYVSAQSQERIKELAAKFSHPASAPEQSGLVRVAGDDDNIKYSYFPIVGLATRARGDWNVGASEISFSGKVQNYCVCIIDMIGSTKVSSKLTPTQLGMYYLPRILGQKL